jgi:multiple sugar transport system ATP-binding protein
VARVELRGVRKSFKDNEVVRGVDLDVADGTFLVLVGPSGCGKTTLLRLIAGLEQCSAGEIRIGERVVNDIHPKDRDAAMVFQSYALYPHKTVFENVAFGLRLRGVPEDELRRRVEEVAGTLGLSELLARKPRELSGGQRQRVAMGRAIVRKPSVFLFDEPLSNLDAKLRVAMRAEIGRLHQRLRTTSIYVTHDQIEAMTLADTIVVLNEGVVQQQGAPLEVYRQPSNMFVAGFIGSPAMNLLDASLVTRDGPRRLIGTGFDLALPPTLASRVAARADGPIVLGVRPEHFSTSPRDGSQPIRLGVDVVEPMGDEVVAVCTLGPATLTVKLPPDDPPPEGASADLHVDLSRGHLFDPESRRAI